MAENEIIGVIFDSMRVGSLLSLLLDLSPVTTAACGVDCRRLIIGEINTRIILVIYYTVG